MLFNVIFVKKGYWRISFNIICTIVKRRKSEFFESEGSQGQSNPALSFYCWKIPEVWRVKGTYESHTILSPPCAYRLFLLFVWIHGTISFLDPISLILVLLGSGAWGALSVWGTQRGERQKHGYWNVSYTGACAQMGPLRIFGKGPLFSYRRSGVVNLSLCLPIG